MALNFMQFSLKFYH